MPMFVTMGSKFLISKLTISVVSAHHTSNTDIISVISRYIDNIDIRHKYWYRTMLQTLDENQQSDY